MPLIHTKKRNFDARVRERQVIELRRDGATFTEIGQILGVTHVGASKIYKRVVNRIVTVTNESAEEVRWQELDRLDALHAAHWPFALAGDVKSSAIILRIAERRSALLGLDAPKKVEVEDVTDIDSQITRLLERVKSGREVSAPLEIDRSTKSTNPPGRVVELARISG